MLLLAGCDGGVGPEGPPGNANVTAVHFDFEADEATVNGPVASIQYEVPLITGSVVENGAVLLFFRDQETWTAMPYTYGVESPELPAVDYMVTLGYAYEHRFLEVFYELSTEEVNPLQLPDRRIKAVIIDGTFAGKTGPDPRDWEAVKAYYGLDE